MKFTILSLVVIFAVALIACNKKLVDKTVETPTVETPPVEITKPVVESEPEERPGKSDREIYKMVNFKKTACYGKCPIYEVEIYNDGRAVYNGKKFVERLGLYEARISEKDVKMIRTKFDEVGFIDLSNEYPTDGQKISDLPSTIIEYRVGDMIKHVTDKHDAPEKLKKFEGWLADYFDGLDWKMKN